MFRYSFLESVVFARPSAQAMAAIDRPAARKMPIWSLSSSELRDARGSHSCSDPEGSNPSERKENQTIQFTYLTNTLM